MVLTRRDTIAATLVAAILKITGQEVVAKTHAEACIPTGKKCPSRRPGGKHSKKLGCNKCCQNHSASGRCTCQPDGQACTLATECCSGVCANGVCPVKSTPQPTIEPPVVPPPPPAPECAPIGELEACATQDGHKLTLTTTCPDGYGAFAVVTPVGITFSDITNIKTDFDFETNTCGAGTPRVCVVFTDENSCVCAQFPADSGCTTPGANGGTGNLLNNDTAGDWFVLCDTPLGPVSTYAEALALYGAKTVDYVFAVADISNGNADQTVTLEDFCVKTA